LENRSARLRKPYYEEHDRRSDLGRTLHCIVSNLNSNNVVAIDRRNLESMNRVQSQVTAR